MAISPIAVVVQIFPMAHSPLNSPSTSAAPPRHQPPRTPAAPLAARECSPTSSPLHLVSGCSSSLGIVTQRALPPICAAPIRLSFCLRRPPPCTCNSSRCPFTSSVPTRIYAVLMRCCQTSVKPHRPHSDLCFLALHEMTKTMHCHILAAPCRRHALRIAPRQRAPNRWHACATPIGFWPGCSH
jgi:hypothetical protein